MINFGEILIYVVAFGISEFFVKKYIKEFDDIDDFNGYFEPSFTDYPAFSCSVAVEYVSPTTGFHIPQSSQTNYKSIMVKVSHPTLSSISDTMIISPGI